MGCGAVNPSEIDNKCLQTVLTLNRIYERKELIGSGTYGKVYRCINKLNGQEYALKVVEITAKTKEQALKQINNLKAEIGVLKKLGHENIVKYYSFDISNDNRQVEIVLEYAKKGSLKEYISQRGMLSDKEASGMTEQILRGLKYLHDQNIVHRDLKCANILMMGDNTLKISDFGTAKSIKISSNEDIAKVCSSLKGTPYYMAPQVLRRTGHGISADIWSLGCLVIEMVSGKAPWTALTSNFEEIISYIVTGIHPPFPKGLSDQCECFLQSCLDNVPSQRLNAEELLKHRWIDHTTLERMKVEYAESNRGTSSIRTKDCEILQQVQEKDDRPVKKRMRQQKYKQIDNYMSDRTNGSASKRKLSSQKNSKQKKDRSAIIKMSQKDLNLVEQEDIEVAPHIESEVSSRIPSAQKSKGKQLPKKDEMMKVTRTTPQMRLPQEIIHELKQIQQHSLQFPLLSTKGAVQQPQQPRMKTEGAKEAVIDTHISRQQRLKYVQIQRQLREQRQQQKRRWQQQLKQGANYLRKEITNRYNV